MSAGPLPAYWLALRGTALAGVTERNMPAAPPGMPEALVDIFSRGTAAQRVLRGAGILWPLLQDSGPRIAFTPPAVTQAVRSPEAEALLDEIMHDAGSIHWPEKRVRLTLEWLHLARRAGIRVPGWHLPALLDLALDNRKLAESLRKVVPKGQWKLVELRDAWSQLARISRPVNDRRKLNDVLLDPDRHLEERREALELLLADRGSPVYSKIGELARRCYRVHHDPSDDGDILPLDPKLHADWLPAAVLPEVPRGLVPRDTYLQRAFAILSMAPIESWVRPKSRGKLLCGRFLERVESSRYPEGLVWAFGKSVMCHGPSRHVEDLLRLCYSEYAWILEDMGALSSLRQEAPYLLQGEKKSLSALLSNSRGEGIGSPIMEAIFHMEPLEPVFFHRAIREVFKSIKQSPEGALTTALEYLSLVVEPVPEDSFEAVCVLAAKSPATAAAWERAHSLLLFRRRMKDVFNAMGNTGPVNTK